MNKSNNILKMTCSDGETYGEVKKKLSSIAYEEKKEKLQAKVTCDECGNQYTQYNKSNHMHSKRHIGHCLIAEIKQCLSSEKKIDKTITKKINEDLDRLRLQLSN